MKLESTRSHAKQIWSKFYFIFENDRDLLLAFFKNPQNFNL